MQTQDVVKAATESALPVSYIAARIFGLALPDWVAIGTLIYLGLQGCYLLWRWHRAWSRHHSGQTDA